MREVISLWSEIGKLSIVAERSIVRKDQKVENNVVVAEHPQRRSVRYPKKEKNLGKKHESVM